MENNVSLKSKTFSGLFWMFFQRIGGQLVSFVVSIVLARLLLPEEYGIISIVMIFVNLCNVFVTSGWGKALIQNKDADDIDFSSVFYFNIVFSIVMYLGLFLVAPIIATFYEMPLLTPVIRVMGIRLIITSVNSIQHAKVTKSMQFKKYFFSTLGGNVCSAIVGISLAYAGAGVWALVAQYMTSTLLDTLILFVTVKWRPKLLFSFARLKILIQYGWKVLATDLVNTIYEDFRGLYVGKLYSPADLAYYTRGQSYSHLVVNNINSTISSVLFPVIANVQDSIDSVKSITRRAIKTSSYVITPMIMGLAVVAEPTVRLLLTDKWLPCVPYLQILCINGALMPLNTANVQAMNAVGRSDLALKLGIAKKTFGFTMILIFARYSILAMTYAGVATGIVSLILNAVPNKKLFNYGIFEQIRDIIPCWVITAGMMLSVWGASQIPINNLLLSLAVQVLIGVVTYLLLSIIFKIESFFYILKTVKGYFRKK